MQSWKSFPLDVVLNAPSTHEISLDVVLSDEPHLLQRDAHGEPDATLNPSTAGKKLLKKTATRAIARILDSRSPSMVDKKHNNSEKLLFCQRRTEKEKKEAKRQIKWRSLSHGKNTVRRKTQVRSREVLRGKSFFFQCPKAFAPGSTGGYVIAEWGDPVGQKLATE